jgi:hypothetical protein
MANISVMTLVWASRTASSTDVVVVVGSVVVVVGSAVVGEATVIDDSPADVDDDDESTDSSVPPEHPTEITTMTPARRARYPGQSIPNLWFFR